MCFLKIRNSTRIYQHDQFQVTWPVVYLISNLRIIFNLFFCPWISDDNWFGNIILLLCNIIRNARIIKEPHHFQGQSQRRKGFQSWSQHHRRRQHLSMYITMKSRSCFPRKKDGGDLSQHSQMGLLDSRNPCPALQVSLYWGHPLRIFGGPLHWRNQCAQHGRHLPDMDATTQKPQAQHEQYEPTSHLKKRTLAVVEFAQH